jgi:RimJ/RimL family protein N-acetyltransferase
MSDADEVFNCITPAITRFMPWEPPQSLSEYKARRERMLLSKDQTLDQTKDQSKFSFVIRRIDNMECLGLAALEDAGASSPELGIWLKERMHGHGYGREAVGAVAEWASKTLGKDSFIYPVAVHNIPSRRIAESFRSEIIGSRTNPKYDSVVYKIPWKA